MNTKGGMKKSRMKVDNIRQKRASLLTKDGIEYGYLSQITGIVADNQLSTPLALPSISLECHAAMEIGYEHEIRNTNSAIGVLAYFNMGFWNSLPKATGAPIIQVAPIMDKNNPVPTVTVNNAYNALLTSYIPMQFGIKLYYAFTL